MHVILPKVIISFRPLIKMLPLKSLLAETIKETKMQINRLCGMLAINKPQHRSKIYDTLKLIKNADKTVTIDKITVIIEMVFIILFIYKCKVNFFAFSLSKFL